MRTRLEPVYQDRLDILWVPEATNVERQPFRSMGFVSVIIVSALFALGLPLVS